MIDILKKDIVFNTGKLSDLLAPPFSVIDLERKVYKNRKKMWQAYLPALGNSRENDENNVNRDSCYDVGKRFDTISVFNPFICEIVYKWFSNKNDKVLDPFAGGAVRGYVASYLDRQYTGCDVNEKQIKDNLSYLDLLKNEQYKPNYFIGSSEDFTSSDDFDLLFTCPPYFNLELYDGGEKDLSMLPSYDLFIQMYEKCLSNCCKYIKDNSFACLVIGDFRSNNGFYYDFRGDTIKIMQKNNFFFYNEMIIKTPVGSACIFANNFLLKSRKIAKIHQNLLVFYKGSIDLMRLSSIKADKSSADNQPTIFDFI